MTRLRLVVPAALAVAALGCGAESGRDHAAETAEFWTEREASYRASERGPFTAVRAWYLAYREEAHIYVIGDTLATEPIGRGAALRVNFAAPGFLVGPVKPKGFDFARLSGRNIRESWFVGKEAGDSLDIRVGRYLVSLGMQDALTGRVLVYDPDLLEERFHGFPVFPHGERYRVSARVLPGDGEVVNLGTSRGLTKDMVRAAILEFEVDGEPCRLTGFRSVEEEDEAEQDDEEEEGEEGPAPPFFVPFRDASSGEETYGVGRYLRVEAGENGKTEINFNRATNPWCAYSEFYNCILPPSENELAVAILAGEKAPAGH